MHLMDYSWNCTLHSTFRLKHTCFKLWAVLHHYTVETSFCRSRTHSMVFAAKRSFHPVIKLTYALEQVGRKYKLLTLKWPRIWATCPCSWICISRTSFVSPRPKTNVWAWLAKTQHQYQCCPRRMVKESSEFQPAWRPGGDMETSLWLLGSFARQPRCEQFGSSLCQLQWRPACDLTLQRLQWRSVW